jgi:hypothetical protein
MMNKHSIHRRAWCALGGLLLMAANSVQAATIVAFSSVVFQPPGESSTSVSGSPGGTSTTNFIGMGNIAGMAAAGYGRADYGALHARASATAIAGARNETRGQGEAYWVDQLTITSDPLKGQQAFARAGISLSGSLASYSPAPGTGVGIGNSTVGASVTVNGSTVFSDMGQLVSWNGEITTNEINRGLALNGVYQINPASDLTGTFWFDIPFEFGIGFQLGATLNAFAQAMYEASAASDFSHSVYWAGISNVHLADGKILSGYSISSQSGFDWGNPYLQGTPGAGPGPGPEPGPGTPVPAPATAWLVGAGLLGLVGVRRGEKVKPGKSSVSDQSASV